MELDDLKNTWEKASSQADKQQNIHLKIINEMTQNKYHSKLKRITLSEMLGTIICLAGAAFIGFNFGKLDTVFLQATGAISILLLLVLPVISLISLRQFNVMGDMSKSYAETLKRFAIQKLQFHKLQKINITLSYLLLVTTIILFSKFFIGKDITDNTYFWTLSFSLGYIFLLFYSKWVLKHYRNTLQQAEELLKELQP